MTISNTKLLLVAILFAAMAKPANAQTPSKPNVIFILEDDAGYETITANGGQSYSTPNIDYLAQNGMRFTHCEATPVCSPSRTMLLTGKYNFRNYSIWGYMNHGEKTIGNLMKDAGYETAWFGKLQLYGHDSDILNMGFNQYLVFEMLSGPTYSNLYRYKSPVLYSNGEVRMPDSLTVNKYGDDILTQQLCDFIDSNQHRPFFAYYPMSLCHNPDSPTPDDSAFASYNPRIYKDDSSYFPSMVKYMDKKIGLITAKLQADGLDQNTIIIFAGDNGTASFVTSIFDNQEFDGAKGQTTEAGTHVPLIAWWPGHIAAGSVNDDLVDFTDFFPTLADASNTTDLSSYGAMDGKSFYPRLLGQAGNPRDWIFDHVTARPGFSLPARRWVQNKTYKLYDTTVFPDSKKFYNIVNDRLEVNPLPDSVLTADEIATKNYFQSILDTMPHPPATPGLDSAFAFNITNSSATIGGRVVSDGGSALKERGSLISTYQNPAYYIFGRLPDSLAILGTFQQNRTKLKPQTSYNYSLYAMNNNNSYNTGFVRVNPAFITCSSPPLAQPLSFTAKAASCSVDLRWGAARFPKSGATQAGYLIVYSTQTPSLKADPNRKYPNRIVSTGSIALVGPTNMPVTPAQTDTIGGLSPDSVYHFLIVPYTWNGTDTTTYIYLTAGALTATSSVLASKMAVGLTAQKLLCANDNSGIITASASRGKAPYLYSINAGSFGSASVFNHLAAGRDTIAVKDAFGCSVTGSIAVTQPAVLSLLISRTNVSCKGASDGTVTLTGRGGTAPYLYSFNGGVYDTVSLFTGLAAGTYSLSVKDNNSCIFSSSVRLPQSTITCSPLWAPAGGSESLSMLSGLKVGIYPNPSQSQFSLMLTNVTSTKPVIIKVVDMYGKVRNSYTGVTNHTYTFGSGFVAGIYLVQVQQGNEVKTIKIIKSK